MEICVKARPWLTAKELKPLVKDMFVHTTKPGPLVAQTVAIGSGVVPSVAGPRNCGQSAPKRAR